MAARSRRYPSSLVGRNVEHGLHIWFGHYENAFRMLQEVYALRGKDPNRYFTTWQDVFKPRNLDSIGIQMPDGWAHVDVEWKVKPGYPGDGTHTSMGWGAWTDFLEMVKEIVDHYLHHPPSLTPRLGAELIDKAMLLFAVRSGHHPDAPEQAEAERLASAADLSLADVIHAACIWASALGSDHTRHGLSHPQAIVGLLGAVDDALRTAPQESKDPVTVLLEGAINVGNAVLRGWWDDLIEPDAPFDTLDDQEFSAWLIKHGATPAIVETSPAVRQVYDTSFQYDDGNPARPNYAAGTALGVFTSLMTQYKGSILYLVQAGFGEAVVAPIYQTLVDAGVRFKFFRKVSEIELSPDKNSIARVKLDVQAETISGDYRPTDTFTCANGKQLTIWPAEPFWEQLKNGGSLRNREIDFESNWCPEQPVGSSI